MSLKNHPDVLDCTVYRPDENDPDAEELELGDARIVIEGAFEAPGEWDAAEREDYFDDSDPALFVTALIECEAKADSGQHFVAEPGDYVAVVRGLQVEMYYVYDRADTSYVLIRDDQLD
ncbi:hypothetical protein [Pseudomonas sp. ML96]|uniref:hypothetical protein n=1 Tax=Pseudomonas sp. ML96 TaxID=1523503 RepID=UPI0005BD1F49|nr:hypothetical protein [Pseudomonas sp. ML96]